MAWAAAQGRLRAVSGEADYDNEVKTMSKKFDKLAGRVEREYERKGVSKKTAEKWGKATAGKVFREKIACGHCGGSHLTEHHFGKPSVHML